MRALSIAGAYPLLLAKGVKKIEVRKWEEKQYRGIVLLHCSSSKAFDFSYDDWDISLNQCPKSAIIGAAYLTNCIKYDSAKKWEADIDNHKWDSDYEDVLEEYEGKIPFGHVFEFPVIFEKPLFNVAGTFRYWIPKTAEQNATFKEAANLIDAALPEILA